MDDNKLQHIQIYKLLGYMQSEKEREWLASDFQTSPYYIGYEAGPRLCDLCDRGLAIRVGKKNRYVIFKLSELGKEFTLTSPLPKSEKKKKVKQMELKIEDKDFNFEKGLRDTGFMGLLQNGEILFTRGVIVVRPKTLQVRIGAIQFGDYYTFNNPREIIATLSLLTKYRCVG